jgi:flagellar assembly factor FliW
VSNRLDDSVSVIDTTARRAVATIPEDAEKATVNLMAPIVINEAGRYGKQVILPESGYSVRHPLFAPSKIDAQTPSEHNAGG